MENDYNAGIRYFLNMEIAKRELSEEAPQTSSINPVIVKSKMIPLDPKRIMGRIAEITEGYEK